MKEKSKNPIGRPTTYTKEIGDTICEYISTSSLGLHRLHKKYDDFPHPGQVCRWLLNNKDFREQYRIAREMQMEFLEEELLEIADDNTSDIETVKGMGGVQYEKENKEVVNRSKLRIHTRMWLMGKIKPKTYGKEADKIEPDDKKEVIIKIVRDAPAKKIED